MALRSPANSQAIVAAGAVDCMVAGMQKHPTASALQRQACLALRNIAGRCPDLRPYLLDHGAENALRQAGRLQDAVDEAYAALRDLECEVQYVKVSAGGVVEAAYEHFGGQGKLNFNPSYGDTDDMDARVEAKAQAPFKADHSHADGDDADCC